ncbi:MAG: nicotinate-nucleotide/dimethylbenzimidazole phosphoribosyltransferase [Gemmatimonadetes bacterium]|nr:nicotinate-nucleotide/dimethylbenzimidazole phosphoribosyltransferase [Gemmatimonadota bacterium]
MTTSRPDTPSRESDAAPLGAAREAVYDVIAKRRDIRNFRPDPVPDEVLHRILTAAHQAGSVGLMQPWDFIVVRREETRRRAYEAFRRANERAARHFADDRAVAYGALKLQGVLDAPVAILVTCDTLRGGVHVLGRDTMPEMDRYSTCLAIQNLWLAARVEEVGVGWVSIVEPADLVSLFGLPSGVIPIAYLCVGYPVTFADAPMLETTGWRQRMPLEAVVHSERWQASAAEWGQLAPAQSDVAAVGVDAGTRSPSVRSAADDEALIAVTIARIGGAVRGDAVAAAAARRLDALAKPRGSLGELEAIAIRMARIQGSLIPRADAAHVLLFAADHGVAVHGVSAFRAEVTAKLCYAILADGATANALARAGGASLTLVDVGVDHDFAADAKVLSRKVRRGTRDLSVEAALTRDEVLRAVGAGIAAVEALEDVQPLVIGEVGIGNTTSAAAVAALFLARSAAEMVGLGTGVGEQALARKREHVERALVRARATTDAHDPIGVLAEVGGLEIAAMTGAILAGAARGAVVVLDGMIVGVAALAAALLAPAASDACIASHVGAEPAHAALLERLGLDPLLDLGLRLGEGSGALLALPLLRAACVVLAELRTWEEMGIAVPSDPRGTQ